MCCFKAMKFGSVTFNFMYIIRRRCSSKAKENITSVNNISKLRNIGVFAHIDAGKTTTTERMLYFSGKISLMGEVHKGNTVTDFLEQERQRGITIQSAVVSFPWKKFTINLVDTPGHLDFTMEVEQCLNAIDCGIIILDASSGVEAQTVKIWNQLSRKNLPCLIYANKFDRKDADIKLCHDSLKERLQLLPLVLHIPHKGQNNFCGFIDLPSFSEMIWSEKGFSVIPLLESHDCYIEAFENRIKLVDTLSTLDDNLADLIMERESLEAVTCEELKNSLRRVTLSRKAVPVLIGSSFKNVGIQCLMDAITEYLPSPTETEEYSILKNFEPHLVARAFKVMHDKHKGSVTFFRIFAGEISKSKRIYNISKRKSEDIGRMMIPFANDFEEIESGSKGMILAITGLKETASGDLISSGSSSLTKARLNMQKSMKLLDHEIDSFLQLETKVPDPVFFCSIEAPSLMYEKKLEAALLEMQREDPSLQISKDPETGQTILAGMGELHLEILKERLKTDYKLDAYIGKPQIAYKERLKTKCRQSCSVTGTQGQITISLSLHQGDKEDILALDYTEDSSSINSLSPAKLAAVRRGISSALLHGPKISSPLASVHAVLHSLQLPRSTVPSAITAVAYDCIKKCLMSSGTDVMEPMMLMNILISHDHTNSLYADLIKRRSKIKSVNYFGNTRELKVETPMAELFHFSSDLMTLSSGTASFTMSFLCYEVMSENEEKILIKQMGLD